MSHAFSLTALGAVLTVSVYSTGCAKARVPAPAAGPRTTVILLPEPTPEATSGAVVSNAAGSVELRSGRDATHAVGQLAPSAPAPVDDRFIEQAFGETIAALPAAAEHIQLYFLLDSDELTPESRGELPRVISVVTQRPVPEVTVIGHTDTTGNAKANYELGLRRASAVAKLLVASGLDAALVEVASHGESDPLVKTADGVANARNRRVEITIK